MPPNSRPNRTMLRRALFLLAACGIAAFAVLMLQLFRLQILRHDELESAALQQQLRRTSIPASRGTIYDREGRVLAMSATTYTVYVSPAEISMNGEDAERIASGLSEILGIDREKILTMTADRRSWYKTVKRQIEEAEADAVRAFKNEYDLQGVKLEPDTKLLLPVCFARLACHRLRRRGQYRPFGTGVYAERAPDRDRRKHPPTEEQCRNGYDPHKL